MKKVIFYFLFYGLMFSGCAKMYNGAYPKEISDSRIAYTKVDTSYELQGAEEAAKKTFADLDQVLAVSGTEKRSGASGRFNAILREYKRSKE